jgi:hypothetical protein
LNTEKLNNFFYIQCAFPIGFMFSFVEQMPSRKMNIGTGLYNKLPNKIREVEKTRQFAIDLRPCLLQHTFYSVDDFMSC